MMSYFCQMNLFVPFMNIAVQHDDIMTSDKDGNLQDAEICLMFIFGWSTHDCSQRVGRQNKHRDTETHWLPAIRLQQQKTSSVFAKTVTDIKASLLLCCLNDCQLVGKYSLDKIPSVVLLNFPFLTSKLQSFCHHTHSAVCIAVVSCHCMIGHTTHTVSLYQWQTLTAEAVSPAYSSASNN